MDLDKLFILATDFESLTCECDCEDCFEKVAAKKGDKWKKMPKGWDKGSRKSYYKSMGKSVGKCMKKMKGNISDPGAFCASLKDREKKTTKWRGQ